MMDIHSDFFVYLEYPCPHIPEKTGKHGRHSKRYKSVHKPKGVGEIISAVPRKCWKSLDLRDIVHGRLKVLCWSTPIYIWKGKIAEVCKWQLVAIKSDGRTADIKFSITSVPEGTPLKRMAWMQRQKAIAYHSQR